MSPCHWPSMHMISQWALSYSHVIIAWSPCLLTNPLVGGLGLEQPNAVDQNELNLSKQRMQGRERTNSSWLYQNHFQYAISLWLLVHLLNVKCNFVTCDTLESNCKICRLIPIASSVDNLYFNRVGNRRVQVLVACFPRANGHSSSTSLFYDVCIDVAPTVPSFSSCLFLRIK